MPAYLDPTRWSITHHVQISSVNPEADLVEGTNMRPVTYQAMEQTIVTNANLQKQLLLEYKRNFKNKSQEYNKFLLDKKSLITILFGQCDETTQTKISLGDTYAEYRDAGRLLAFIQQMRTVYFVGDDGGLSYGPYKQVVAIKSLNTYTNNDPQDPHGYKG